MALSMWKTTDEAWQIRRLGKTLEELGELTDVAARCLIQGIDEVDPKSGEVNRLRLSNEIADVAAQLDCTIKAFGLDSEYIFRRARQKEALMIEWESMHEVKQ